MSYLPLTDEEETGWTAPRGDRAAAGGGLGRRTPPATLAARARGGLSGEQELAEAGATSGARGGGACLVLGAVCRLPVSARERAVSRCRCFWLFLVSYATARIINASAAAALQMRRHPHWQACRQAAAALIA